MRKPIKRMIAIWLATVLVLTGNASVFAEEVTDYEAVEVFDTEEDVLAEVPEEEVSEDMDVLDIEEELSNAQTKGSEYVQDSVEESYDEGWAIEEDEPIYEDTEAGATNIDPLKFGITFYNPSTTVYTRAFNLDSYPDSATYTIYGETYENSQPYDLDTSLYDLTQESGQEYFTISQSGNKCTIYPKKPGSGYIKATLKSAPNVTPYGNRNQIRVTIPSRKLTSRSTNITFDDAWFYYNGNPQRPNNIVVKYTNSSTGKTYTLTEGVDYTVKDVVNPTYGAKVTVTGMGVYTGEVSSTKSYVIDYLTELESVTDANSITSNTKTYTGSPITPSFTYRIGYQEMLTEGVDYVFEDKKPVTNAGTYAYKLLGIGAFSGFATGNFIVSPASIANLSVKDNSATYMGSNIAVSFNVVWNGKTLKAGTDYTVSPSTVKNEGTTKVTITGKGNFTGTTSANFKVIKTVTPTPAPVSIANAAITFKNGTSYTYTGSEIKPEVTVTTGGKTLTSGTDYSVSYTNNVNKGTATVTVRGKGGYRDTAKKTFTITAANLKDAVLSTIRQSYECTGGPRKPALTVKYNGRTLTADTDYTVSYVNNTYPGTATITATGKGNYTGTAKTTFTLTGIDINTATITTVSKTYPCTGKPRKPKVTVKIGGTKLTENSDYTLAYKDNIEPGTATITVTGKGIYTNTATIHFELYDGESLEGATISTAYSKYEYTGNPRKPKVTVKLGNIVLTRDVDYTVAYKDNVGPGIATIEVTGKGKFKGTATKTFELYKSIANAAITTKYKYYDYTGSTRNPTPTVKYMGSALVKDRDYKLTYHDNINEGTAWIEVRGIGEFAGVKVVNYNIVKSVPVYRLYNGRTWEHFYTISKSERDSYLARGWNNEGIAWYSPKKSDTPIYRVRNPFNNEHHYTKSTNEYKNLKSLGWIDEGIAFYSCNASAFYNAPVYRLYHPKQKTGNHHYTMSAYERDQIVKTLGWRYECISWYAMSKQR